jgi:hypothetical protein
VSHTQSVLSFSSFLSYLDKRAITREGKSQRRSRSGRFSGMLRNHGQQHVEKSESRSLADLLLHIFPMVNKRAPISPLPIFNLRKRTTLPLMLFKPVLMLTFLYKQQANHVSCCIRQKMVSCTSLQYLAMWQAEQDLGDPSELQD